MKTIEEKNRMIAEFMGSPYEWDNNEKAWYDDDQRLVGIELKYHTSWDWLMPVAHKCMQSTDNLHPYAEASVVNAITRGLTSFQIHFAYDEVIKTIEFLQSKTDSHD